MAMGILNDPNSKEGAQLPIVGISAAYMNHGDPYEVVHDVEIANDYVGWEHKGPPIDKRITESHRHMLGHDRFETAYFGNKNDNNANRQLPYENVIVSDEGPISVDPSPDARGKHPYEPNNNPPDDPRIVHAGIGYTFERQWENTVRDKTGFSGDHISLSDNKVILPVGGLAPKKNLRNTYRLEPEPWDVNIVDISVNPAENMAAPPPPQIAEGTHTRSYRLG